MPKHVPRFPRVLLSYNTLASYIVPPVFSPNQVTIGPETSCRVGSESGFSARTPAGEYDLVRVLKESNIDTEFDVVIVVTDPFSQNFPDNLSSLSGVKVACIADIHHGKAPIQRLTQYVSRRKFDFVSILYSRNHMKWFVESGHQNVAWFPGLFSPVSADSFGGARVPRVSFFGQSSDLHPRRKRMLEAMSRAHVPIVFGTMDRSKGINLYSNSFIAFNCSLNGDLNLRVFEALAAGACLLTDRLSESSGIGFLLKEGEEYLAYDSEDDLICKCFDILQDESASLSIARRGWERFISDLSGERRIKTFMKWVSGENIDEIFRPKPIGVRKDGIPSPPGRSPSVPLSVRMKLCEMIQEKNRTSEETRILADSRLVAILRKDFDDFPRVRVDSFDAGVAARRPEPSGRFDIVLMVSDATTRPHVRADVQVRVPVSGEL